MISYIRLLICILGVTLLSPALSQAQQLSVTSITPNPVCAGSAITASYNYTNTTGDVGILYMYLNGPGTTNVLIAAMAVSGGNGSVQGTIPDNRTTGTYTIQLVRQSSVSGSVVAGPASGGFTVNALPAAPGVSNVAYCQNATASPLTATGQNLTWYPASTGGGGTTVAPTPPTSTTGTTNYYVSQTVNGCEGARATLQVTINPPPPKPTVVSSLSYCQGSNPPSLAGAVTSGSNLKWYDSALGGVGSTVAPTPSTASATPTTYYVSQTNGNGCESDRAAITVDIKANPAAPSVTSPVTYCQGAVATPLSATPVSGGTLNWYSPSNTALGSTAPTPPTTSPGTTFYSVSQTVSGCESTKATIQVTVNTRPAAPTTTPVNVCQNTTPVSLATGITSGSNLRWYTTSSGGTGATVAPSPPTTTVGQTPYYVSQIDGNGCESDRAVLTFIVNAYPSAPSVTNPPPYCQNAPANSLTASATPTSGGTLNFYNVANGGTRYADLSPSTAASNNYYVSQTVNGCEGPRATISVTVNALPQPPAVTTPLTYCQFTVAAPLSATATTNNTLYWYGTAANGGSGSTVAPTPSTSNTGTLIYYVNQRDPIGCESPRSQISVTINPKPAAPATTPASACLNSAPNPLTSSVTATGTLTWYTASSGGTGSTVAPTLSTTATGSTTYYVTQTNSNGCESDRAAITFTVNSLPTAPTVASPFLSLCQNSVATSLTATGTNLKWYATNTSVTPLSNPFIPPTDQAGSVVYYVSQTDGNGCESARTMLTVTVISLPVPPTVSSTPVVYCQYDTPVSLSATATTGNTLNWYGQSATGGTASTGSGFTVPTTDTPGSKLYYVSQTDGNGCESSTRAFITVTVNAKPAAPTTTSLTLCQNATTVPLQTAVTSGTNLKWYTAQTGGTMYAGTPVITTTTVGSTTYYVSQTSSDGCESDRSAVVVTIKPLPVAPTVTPNPQLLCQSSVASSLTAIPSAGGTLNWYNDPTGGTPSTVAPIPPTSNVGPINYYVSQTVDGCESGSRTALNIVVIAKPAVPTVTSAIAACQLSTPTALTASGTNLKWYTVSTGGTPSTVAPVPPTDNAGTTPYYVTQTDANGCESDRASISVRIKPKPNAPGITTPISFCANQVTALPATFDANTTPNWYGTNPGSTPTTTAPIPATNVIGAPVNYYVSQTLEGCESDKATIAVTINALPVAPTVSSTPILYCQDATAVPLSATAAAGSTLNWYTASTGGSASATAPTPPTTLGTVLTTYYYVSQTDVNGCEGPRATIAVTINPKPVKPTVVASLSYCQNTTAPMLSATAAGTLKWYADATTTTAIPTPTPSTATPGSTTYYVTQTDVNGCESDRASITVTINETPALPVTSALNVCQDSPPVALTATPSTGGTLNWYTVQTGGTPTSTAPFPPTSATGTTTYYVSQSIRGCEGPRASIVVTVIPLPTIPAVSPNPVSYCQGTTTAVPLTATVSSGGTLNWYTTQFGGTPSQLAPTPPTSSTGTTMYYVSQSVNGCEGPRTSITVIIKPLPVAPVVNSNTVNLCQNTAPVALTATASPGGTLNWYTQPTGVASTSVAPTLSTAATGTTIYYVSQTVNGCEGPQTAIAVIVTPTPNAPVTLPASFCQNEQPTALTATASPGGILNWYTTSVGGISSSAAPAPPTSTTGTTTYYVSQSVNNCEGPRATLDVTIKPLPAAPTVSLNPVSYCQNAPSVPLSATASAGGTLNWYTVQTGGTPSALAPAPSTSTVGPSFYYVSQTVNGCEGPRSSITVNIKPLPTAPVANPTINVCQNTPPITLTATASSGGTLYWYTTQTGGTPSPTAPVITTTQSGITVSYVSQTVDGCEGPRTAITVIITATPGAPGTSPISFCQNGPATALTATANTGATLNWYTASTGGSPVAAPTPPTSTTGTFTYYVSQSANGCEGPRASLEVTIKPLPAAPSVSAVQVSYCQNGAATALTATPSAGGTLNWYTVQTGGTPNASAPIPPTTTAQTLTYYVSQSINGCEGPRASISVLIKPLPVAPSVASSTVNFCQGTQASALSATPSPGGTLSWYTVPTDGTPSAVAPTPPTTAPGITIYYVSQTVNGCEGPRASITVTITATPGAPGTSPVSLCQNAISTPLTAVASLGGTLNWYVNPTGGVSTPIAPSPPTSSAGSQTYYVSQSVSGCEGPRASLSVTIKSLPSAPGLTASALSYCQNETSAALTAIPSSGGTLNWYTVPVNGTPSASAPVPPTSTAGLQNYYVSQTVNGCEGDRVNIAVTIKARPTAPGAATAPLVYCQGIIAPALTASPASGGTLNWYTTQTGGAASSVAPVPPTTTPGLFTYYVSQTVNGCEGPMATITVLIQPTPPAPTVGNAPIYCQGGPATALSAVATSGGTLSWYTTPTGGTGSAIPPVPPVTAAGSVTYYVSQNVNGCEGPRVSLVATIKASPAVPTVTASPAYCQNVTAAPLTAIPNGGVLNWYTASTGGSASSVAPTPPTTTPGTQVYYVSQTDANGCESNRAPVTVKINPLPVAPSTTPATYCQGSVATALVATPGSGGTLNWYTTPSGGTGSPLAPTPITTNSGVLPYYVSQTDINGCESPRSILLVTITATPAAPVFPAVAPVCQNSTPFVLVAAGQSLKWYADATTTASLGSAVTQTTTAPGTFVYYVSQTVNSCESPRTMAQVVVNALPAPPVVATNQSGCQDALVQPLTAAGTALQWYDANDNLISPPTPVTKVDVTQSYTYKVTQTINGCTSPKTTFTYVVNVTPLPTVVSPVAFCQNTTPRPLTATGTNLKWTDPTGAVTTNAPTPPTTVVTAGTSYSVTQTSTLGCESRKAEIKVAINAASAAKLEGTSSVYLGNPAVLTLTLSGVGPYSYTLSDGNTGTAETAPNGEATVRKISVTPAASTTYAVTGVANACGNGTVSGGATVTVRVPTIATSPLSVSTICTGVSFVVPFSVTGEFVAGNAFTVEIASAVGDSASRKYTAIGNGVVQGQSISTSIPTTFAAGQYYVRVIASNAPYPILGTRSPTLITVRSAPAVSISATKDVIFNGQSTELNFALTGEAPWTVTYSNGTQVAAFGTNTNVYSATVTPTTTTTYRLLSVSNGCGTGKIEGVDSVRVRVDVLTAEEDLLSNSVSVYPVPTDGAVTVDIDFPLQKEPAKLQIVGPNGRIVEQITTKKRQTMLDLIKEPAGTYLLHITIGDRSTVRKILKW